MTRSDARTNLVKVLMQHLGGSPHNNFPTRLLADKAETVVGAIDTYIDAAIREQTGASIRKIGT